MRTFLAAVLVVPLALTGCARRTERVRPVQEVDGTTAHRIVKAGVLRPADLPGYRVAGATGAKGAAPATRPNTKGCLTRGAREVTSDDATFERGRAVVISVAGVAPTRAAVREDEAFMRDEFAECWERVVTAWMAEDDVIVRKYTTKPVKIRVPGADAAFGYQIRFTIVGDERSAPFAMSAAMVTVGHGEILVLAMGVPADVPSVAALRSPLTKAVRRVVAAQR